jgi:Legume-like lectin family
MNANLWVLGSVWSKEVNTHEDWEAEVVFRVSGRGRIGADGLVCNCVKIITNYDQNDSQQTNNVK